MVDLGENFEADEHEGPQLLEEGDYVIALTESSLDENLKKTGTNLKLTFAVLEGENAGRKLFLSLCWTNPSLVAVQIAKEKFAQLTKACGKGAIRATEELHDIPINAKVVIQESGNPQYSDSNQILEFWPLAGEPRPGSLKKHANIDAPKTRFTRKR